MAISSSLYSSISGLNTMGNAMSVLGDNVSNVNTVAFKSSRATFQDVLSQSVSTAAGTAQVGRGVTLSTVDGIFAQGSFESTTTPTDLAIGGQGFFMLRAADSAEADMYSRAGEFRFDQEGYLINPVGHFVQGWTIDSETGERQGTIGDIYLGKATPPVATQRIQAIVNLDSREINEVNETRLFEAWNGTNAAAVTPTDPIDSTNYEYTSAIKIYDSQGASHDITIYFDRTTNDNEWEFLVTSDPSEDVRRLTSEEQNVYAPNVRYNFEEHKGAGALMYGLVKFSTSGDISEISAWDVPPDGKVDPALNTNRIVLGNSDSYYNFEANFTGADTNQLIEINLGARYSGLSTNQTQVLVSDGHAYDGPDVTNFITKETTWANVYDAAGNAMTHGDVINFNGFDHEGNVVSGQYQVDSTKKVQDFLDVLGSAFGASATIDAQGRLRMTDSTGGDSGMYITNFTTSSANGSDPFGFGSGSTLSDNWSMTGSGFTLAASGSAVTSTAAVWTDVSNGSGGTIAVGETFTLTGFAIDGTDVAAAGNNVFTVAAGDDIADLLDFIEALYENGDSGTAGTGSVTAILDNQGRLRVIDNTNGSGNGTGNNFAVAMAYAGAGVNPVGPFSMEESFTGLVNISTSKKQLISGQRAVTSAGPPVNQPPVVSASTDWANVYDEQGNGVSVGDSLIFNGVKGDGTNVVNEVFTINSIDSPNNTMQDLLDWLELTFDADATIDKAGRLVLTERVADTAGGTPSSLAITGITGTAPSIFGDGSFGSIPADTSGEDGSRQGDVVSTNFETEALASTQYANASTTIFQDQNGYASGFLQSVSVDTDGVITGHYSNGQVLEKAQVALATFNNMAGLKKEGGNIFTQTTESGAPVTGAPGTNGLGSIAPNSLEQSNVDLGTEFVKLITTQRGFQANSKIITTTDEMLADLINIKR